MEARDLKQEFRELLKASGWSQAEASRQLAMTPSALSQIVRDNSPVKPSPVTLRLFQLLLWRDKPEALKDVARSKSATEPWELAVIRDLRKLPPKTREPILRALRAMVEAAIKNPPSDRRRGT